MENQDGYITRENLAERFRSMSDEELLSRLDTGRGHRGQEMSADRDIVRAPDR